MDEVFRTVVKAPRCPAPIDHRSSILVLGSCFAEHIGTNLLANRFRALVNPTGILYNPVSIAAALDRLIEGRPYTTGNLFFREGVWRSFDHHSSFSRDTTENTLSAINEPFLNAAAALRDLDTLILTLGTAFVYRFRDSGAVVANCHKLPHDSFSRELVSVDEIAGRCADVFVRLWERRPELSIVLTVSPVRHLRDNPHENLVSKSRLVEAVYRLENQFPRGVCYFPSYEIMMDDLRDYRFYGPDMVHPTPVAVEYIWAQFLEACVSERSRNFVGMYEPVRRALDHRPMSTDPLETRTFAARMLASIGQLSSSFPEVDLSGPRTIFGNMAGGI